MAAILLRATIYATITFALLATAASADAQAPHCVYSGWSPPAEIGDFQPGTVLRWPSLSVRGEEGYVVGMDFAAFDFQPMPPNGLLALTLEGKNVGKPAGEFLFAHPRAALDTAGVLHLLWTETDSVKGFLRRGWPLMKRLLHATYEPARGWTEAREIHRAHALYWRDDLNTLGFDSAGRLHTAFVSDPGGMNHQLIRMVLEPEGWRTARLPGPELTGYTGIATGPEGNVYVAYIGPDSATLADTTRRYRQDANSVFVVRSTNGGRTWLPPQLISLSGRRQATSVRVLVAPDGTVHLVWGQNLSGGLRAEILRHVHSRDGGVTWSAPDDLDVPDVSQHDMRAVVDRCGTVHVVFEEQHESGATTPEESMADRSELWYTRWDGGWSEPVSPFPHLGFVSVDMGASAEGPLYLFLSARAATDVSLQINWVPMVSTLPVVSLEPVGR